MEVILIFVGAVIALLLLFTVFRSITLWYWGIHKMHDNKAQIIKELKRIAEKLEADTAENKAV